MTTLNWTTNPWPGPDLEVLEEISIYIPSIGNETIQNQRISRVITDLASLYLSQNLNVSNPSLANYFRTTVDQVTLLQEVLGGADVMEELVLWGANTLRGLPSSGVGTPIMGLVVVLVMLSTGTTAIRIWSRYTVNGKAGWGWPELTLVAGVICSMGIASQFGGSEYSISSYEKGFEESKLARGEVHS